ncbi:MauE/DoxX family redox-associated membrane protein [Actinomadura sp. NAK00032]|uniref:MauE/DoxX family redox-associated membrane protein n=1 Tax=Actinomadura sp. NAK00032 TaxID=2742128 RepID=UPI0034A213CE
MSFAGATAQILLAAVFAYSSLTKVPAFAAFRDVLEKLGAGGAAGPLAAAVIAGEAGTAALLLALPGTPWPRLLVVAFAAGFAAAGLRALTLRERIRCNCFGAGGAGTLGRRQLVLLPVWLAAAGLAQAQPPGWTAEEGLAGLAVLLAAFTGILLPAAARALRTLRGDRAAFAESSGIGVADPVREKELTLG